MFSRATSANWEVDVSGDSTGLATRAADIITDQLRAKPRLLLCAATGSTPSDTYAALTRRFAAEPSLFDQMRVIKLDEWLGMAMDDERSCEAYLRSHLIEPLGISAERYVGFRSDATDSVAECARVNRWLSLNGPIDVCVLGLGLNGHVGLNEPADQLAPHAHVVQLQLQTRNHAMLGTAAPPPTHGVTLGIEDLLEARRILLLVTGTRKRAILHRLLHEPPSPRLPASLLRKHRNMTILCDRAAVGD